MARTFDGLTLFICQHINCQIIFLTAFILSNYNPSYSYILKCKILIVCSVNASMKNNLTHFNTSALLASLGLYNNLHGYS